MDASSRRKTRFERLTSGPLAQQSLPAYQPLLTPVATVGILLFVSVVFIPIGIVLLERSDVNVYQRMRYDNIEACETRFGENKTVWPKVCHFQMTVKEDMKAPIYFFYELGHFHQVI